MRAWRAPRLRRVRDLLVGGDVEVEPGRFDELDGDPARADVVGDEQLHELLAVDEPDEGLVLAGSLLAHWGLGAGAPAAWGVAIGLGSFIPVVGATLVWAPVAIWWLLSGDLFRGIALVAICGLGVGLVDNVLRPLLLSGRTSVNGLVVFLGLLGGVGVFGFVGLVLGPIVLVIASTLLDALTRRPQESKAAMVME